MSNAVSEIAKMFDADDDCIEVTDQDIRLLLSSDLQGARVLFPSFSLVFPELFSCFSHAALVRLLCVSSVFFL